jgi:hypothetical protein
MRTLVIGLALSLAATAQAQQPNVPPPPPAPVNIDSMGKWGEKMGQWGEKYGEAWSRWGESLGKSLGQTFDDTSFKNAMDRDPEVMHDREVKAALRRYIEYSVHHDPRAKDAKQAFEDALHRAQQRRHAYGPPGVPVPPVPPMPPMPPMMPPAEPGSAMTAAMKADIEKARHDPAADPIPATSAFSVGARSIAPGSHVSGPVATVAGPVMVSGMVDGDVVAVDGDIDVQPSGHVTGNVFAAHGTVHVEPGATIEGEIRSLPGPVGPTSVVAATPKAGHSPWRSLELSLAWLCLALVMGIGVLTFAGDRLDTASLALSDQFGRSLLFGLVGLIAIIPVCVIIVVVLFVTIIGIVVSPLAVVAYLLLVLGVAVLGFTAVAETTGHAFYRRRAHALTDRGARLRAVVTGITFYMGLWVLAAAGGWIPVAGTVLHAIAVAVTFLAVTAGFGAVIAARYDARRQTLVDTPPASAIPEMAWQTPTPVGGVAAARRPTPPPPQTPVQ